MFDLAIYNIPLNALFIERYRRRQLGRNAEAVTTLTSVSLILRILLWMDIPQAINIAIFKRFHAEGIEFACPTRTLIVETNQTVQA